MQKDSKLLLIGVTAAIIVIYGLTSAIFIQNINIWRQKTSLVYIEKAKSEQNLSTKLNYYEKAASLEPNENTFLLAGTTASTLGEYKLAESYLVRVKTANGLYALGNTYYGLGFFGPAEQAYRKAVIKDENADYYYALGRAQLKQGELGEAKNALASSYTLKKNEEVGSLLFLAGGNGVAPNVSRETNPANKVNLVYNNLVKLGYPQAAIRTLEIALQNGTLSRDGLIELARVQIKGNDNQQAYDLLIRAKQFDEYYPQVYQQLIPVCEKLGKVEEAKAYQVFLSSLVF